MDCSLPSSSVHGILQARILEWVAISFSRGSSRPRDRTQVSRIGGRCFNVWATREAPCMMRYLCQRIWRLVLSWRNRFGGQVCSVLESNRLCNVPESYKEVMVCCPKNYLKKRNAVSFTLFVMRTSLIWRKAIFGSALIYFIIGNIIALQLLCWFLLHDKANQLYVYIYGLPLEPPSHPSRPSPSTKPSSLCHTAASR